MRAFLIVPLTLFLSGCAFIPGLDRHLYPSDGTITISVSLPTTQSGAVHTQSFLPSLTLESIKVSITQTGSNAPTRFKEVALDGEGSEAYIEFDSVPRGTWEIAVDVDGRSGDGPIVTVYHGVASASVKDGETTIVPVQVQAGASAIAVTVTPADDVSVASGRAMLINPFGDDVVVPLDSRTKGLEAHFHGVRPAIWTVRIEVFERASDLFPLATVNKTVSTHPAQTTNVTFEISGENFGAPPTPDSSLNLFTVGAGSVSAVGTGIKNSTDSEASYSVIPGSFVTLTATPDPGWTFIGWQYAPSEATGNNIELVVNADVMIGAIFDVTPTADPYEVPEYGPGFAEYAGDVLLQTGIILSAVPGVDDLRLDSTLTRAELTTMLVRLHGLSNEAQLLKGASAYPDTASHWASGHIAVGKNIVERFSGVSIGLPDGTFGPDLKVTYADVVFFVCSFLGVCRDAAPAEPSGYIVAAEAINVISTEMASEFVLNADSLASRGMAFSVIYWAAMHVILSGNQNVFQEFHDSTPPFLTIDDDEYGPATQEPYVNVSGRAEGAVEVRINGQPVALGAYGDFTLGAPLHFGSNTIVVSARDLVGNVSEHNFTIIRG